MYGNLVWAITHPSRLHKIPKIQKKMVHLMISNYTDSSKPLGELHAINTKNLVSVILIHVFTMRLTVFITCDMC